MALLAENRKGFSERRVNRNRNFRTRRSTRSSLVGLPFLTNPFRIGAPLAQGAKAERVVAFGQSHAIRVGQ